MQKEEARLASAFSFCTEMQITQACYSRSALGSTIAAPGDPGKDAPRRLIRTPPPRPAPPPPIETTFTPSPPRVIRTALHLTYRVAIISTHQGLSPHIPHTARISRQNVSLVVVLERRALNFEFSYTFPLNGTRRQRRRKKGEEGVKEGTGDGLGRRLEPWTQREGEQRRE